MIIARTAILLAAFALCSCEPEKAPDAAPGAVERATDAIDRNEAAGRVETIKRMDRDAEARAEDSKRRIKAVEREKAEAN